MKENMFHYSERGLKKDPFNKIMYFVGPIEIRISGWSEEIKLICKKEWYWALEQAKEVIKEAWEVKESQIKTIEKYDKKIIIIKYNYKNLKLYIEHPISMK